MKIENFLNSKKDENKEISIQEIVEVLELSKDAFNESNKFANYIEKELTIVSDILKKELGPSYLGSFGLGYPFYAKNKSEFFKVDEINNFITKGVQEVIDKNKNTENWICPGCQTKNKPTDLISVCNNCKLVGEEIKPRKILATIPDLDMLVILNEADQATLEKVQGILHSKDYKQSDISIKDSFRNTKKVLEDLKNNKESTSKLPIDLHVLTGSQFKEIASRIAKGEKSRIKCPALHMTWENHDLQIWFDFVFSMKEIDLTSELREVLLKSRKMLKESWGEDNLVDAIKNYYPRIQRIFETKEVEIALRDKIKTW